MALDELSKKSKSRISLVPCGLTYSHANKFRSRVLVEFGPPIEVSEKLVDMFQSGERSDAVLALLEEIRQSLLAVTFTAADFETLRVSSLAPAIPKAILMWN